MFVLPDILETKSKMFQEPKQRAKYFASHIFLNSQSWEAAPLKPRMKINNY